MPVPDETGASAAFRESRISIAIDVSGSTYGATLEAEKLAARSVCSLIPPSLHDNITILPWSDDAYPPEPLSRLATIRSSGGTNPNVLVLDSDCRFALQSSEFWFLMTDGLIDDGLVRQFARNLTDYSIHGKGCVISVFGQRLRKPSDCNITVGLSVFAVSPNVAFLYTDVDSNTTYVLSTKGCFSTLLPPGEHNPRLDYDTTWDDLPRVSYENFARNIRVNIPALLDQEDIDEDLMQKIMLNEDNMKTIAITAALKGNAPKLDRWLDNVKTKIEDIETRQSSDTLESQLMKDTTTRLSQSESSQPPRQVIPTRRLSASINSMRKSSVRMDDEREHQRRVSSYSYSHLYEEDSEDSGTDENGVHEIARERLTKAEKGDYDKLNLAVPGFRRPTQRSEFFSSTCPMCSTSGRVLTLVLRDPSPSATTKDLPLPGSLSKLVYPLTMGNYAETDIITNTIACDVCAAGISKNGTNASGDRVAAVLPLVSYDKNQDAWLQTVALATGKRFSRSDLALVFLGILYTKIERLVPDPSKLADLQDALRWECNIIQTEVVLHADSISGIKRFGAGVIQEVLLRNYRDSLDAGKVPLLLSYPLDGFVAANAAISHTRYKQVLTQAKRKQIVFLRLLFHLLESYHRYREEQGDLQLHAAKTLVLLIDDPSGPRSLFRWDSMRQLSVHFKNLHQFRGHLRATVTLNKYRLSLQVSDLLDTPLLDAKTLAGFRRLGPLFSWIESEAGNGIAVFVHYMMRLDVGSSPEAQFQKLRERPEVSQAIADPGALSARNVEELIGPLPPLE
ncbi:hypothetical protein B0T16DRAFT_458181 [Cercophora newfieldiana]|uniref:Uncharacterized protein n=1 Tax=Cercophora newfieldiana TaxID=92897 RepID=A0AA40CPV2_9PEZI|nr:hypothetical protein B0T16DRAFT_458181 [Cercophora newfieldiana]